LVRCSHCRTKWTADQFGILGAVIAANQTQETMVDKCVWPSCPYRGPHDRHEDGAGRLFTDRCDIHEGTTA
jgi:hypothetical protein